MRSKDNSRRLILYSFFADKILSISNYCKNNIPKPLQKKVKVINNFFNEIDLKKKRKKNFFVIAFIANFKNQKRPELFFKIINQINEIEKKIKIRFYIFGNLKIDQKKLLLKHIKKRVYYKNIFFKGYQFPIDPWLRESDISISLGVNEGFGRVLVESMLNRSLVIATSGGGHNEILKDKVNGILIDSHSPEILAKRIVYYLKNWDISNKIINDAYLHSRKKYILNNRVSSITNIYNSLFKV